MKLRYFYKIDHKKQPIPGSNVRRKSKPKPFNQWVEIEDPCCTPLEVGCTCDARYFVQLDGRGKPVDGALIKRFGFPKMEDGIHYMELQWKSVCCPACLSETIISQAMPEVLEDEQYTVAFCGVSALINVVGTSEDTAAAATILLNLYLTNNPGTLDGVFSDNGNGTISYIGNTCDCVSTTFQVGLIEE